MNFSTLQVQSIYLWVDRGGVTRFFSNPHIFCQMKQHTLAWINVKLLLYLWCAIYRGSVFKSKKSPEQTATIGLSPLLSYRFLTIYKQIHRLFNVQTFNSHNFVFFPLPSSNFLNLYKYWNKIDIEYGMIFVEVKYFNKNIEKVLSISGCTGQHLHFPYLLQFSTAYV